MGATAVGSRGRGETQDGTAVAADGGERPACCGLYHRAIELVGKRWTGAILFVLMDGPLHFSGIRQLVPELSDRLLSERLKELEAEGIVERRVLDSSPVRVEYSLTPKGRALEPTLGALKQWAQIHLPVREP
jgi:DNA-binding HxlR family transcriptional regulator